MKLICVVKYVPDVDRFHYDFDNNTLVREGKRQILNPDDACAVAYALQCKEKWPDTVIQVITMGPLSVIPYMKDLIRTGIDAGVILSDQDFAGSDTYATGRILSAYLKTQDADFIVTGTGSLDGDTSHVPAQIAEWLGLPQLSGITQAQISDKKSNLVQVTIDREELQISFEVNAPAVLSFSRESKYKLPYIKKENISREIEVIHKSSDTENHLYERQDREDHLGSIVVLDRTSLMLEKEEVGLEGSLTQVRETYVKNYNKKDSLYIKADEDGAEIVYRYLKEKGILS